MEHTVFGTKHLILIAISLVLIVCFYFLSRKWKFSTLCKTLFGIAIVCELIKTFTYIVINEDKYGGVLPKSDLPFQLCSIQLIFIAIVIFTKNEKVKRAILSFMLPSCLFGSLAAIFIATSSSLNIWIITFQYFIYHISLCTFAIHLFTNKDYKWNVKDYVTSLIFVVCFMFVAIYLNSMMYDGVSNVNFMYVVKPPVDGIPYLNNDSGWLSYIAKYALLVIVCLTLCYIKPIVCAIRDKIKSNKENKVSKVNKDN